MHITRRCPVCKSAMIRRNGPHGEFWGCSNYPACKGTRKIRVRDRYINVADFDRVVAQMEETFPQEDPRRPAIREKNRIFHKLTQVDNAIHGYRTRGAAPPQVLLVNQERMRSALQVVQSKLDAVRAKVVPIVFPRVKDTRVPRNKRKCRHKKGGFVCG